MNYLFCFILCVVLSSCNYNNSTKKIVDYEILEPVLDLRDSNYYKVIRIENQIWMAENLRYDAGVGSYCYEDNPENCKKGRIYTWNTAMNNDSSPGSKGICPDGWHLPKGEEWDLLIANLGGDTMASLLKVGGIGFEASLNGGRMAHDDGSFNYMRRGTDVCFWTSDADSNMAFDRNLSSRDNKIDKRSYPKEYGFCVRCIKD